MKNNDEEQSWIRRHLLGELTDQEQAQLEEQFISDSQYREKVLVIEDELIEDYLADNLSEEEKERFLHHFLSTPQQIEKLKIARALNQYFSVEGVAASSAAPFYDRERLNGAEPAPSRFLRLRNLPIALALVALLLVAIFVGSQFLLERRRPQEQLLEGQELVQEFQRELTRLNNPRSPVQGTPNDTDAMLRLSSISLRGAGKLSEVTLHTRAGVVQLLLTLPADEYKRYRVVLQKSGEANRLTVDDLVSENMEGGKTVMLKIPSKHLSRGDYLLELNGLSAEGHAEAVGGYSFRILN